MEMATDITLFRTYYHFSWQGFVLYHAKITVTKQLL
jgi:hypothetical protein